MDQLQEAARLRPALVQLPGGVQEARAVAERGRLLGRVADRGAELAHRRVELVGRLDVAHDRDVRRWRRTHDLREVAVVEPHAA
jgi:hypothetical protein